MEKQFDSAEFVVGGVKQDRISRMSEFALGTNHTDCYRSLFLFDDGYAEYVRRTGSVSGYAGLIRPTRWCLILMGMTWRMSVARLCGSAHSCSKAMEFRLTEFKWHSLATKDFTCQSRCHFVEQWCRLQNSLLSTRLSPWILRMVILS